MILHPQACPSRLKSISPGAGLPSDMIRDLNRGQQLAFQVGRLFPGDNEAQLVRQALQSIRLKLEDWA
jgi:hypothetical protein